MPHSEGVLIIGSYTLTVGIASAAVYSVLEPISEDTGLTLNLLNNGTGYMVSLLEIAMEIAKP